MRQVIADRPAWRCRLIRQRNCTGPVGPYQLQAAIAALHDEAAVPEHTDWPQILALYDVLTAISPNPSRR